MAIVDKGNSQVSSFYDYYSCW